MIIHVVGTVAPCTPTQRAETSKILGRRRLSMILKFEVIVDNDGNEDDDVWLELVQISHSNTLSTDPGELDWLRILTKTKLNPINRH